MVEKFKFIFVLLFVILFLNIVSAKGPVLVWDAFISSPSCAVCDCPVDEDVGIKRPDTEAPILDYYLIDCLNLATKTSCLNQEHVDESGFIRVEAEPCPDKIKKGYVVPGIHDSTGADNFDELIDPALNIGSMTPEDAANLQLAVRSVACPYATSDWSDRIVYSHVDCGVEDGEIQRGDANGDGNINVADMVTILSFLSNRIPLFAYCYDGMDVDGDGRVDISDFLELKNMIFGGG